jgi:ribosome recycling factor
MLSLFIPLLIRVISQLQELNDKYIKEVDKILAELKKSTGAK